jgi:hypothetical protein
MRARILSGSHIVLDLSEADYLGADALGMLVHLVQVARSRRKEVWLTGLRPLHRLVAYASHLRTQFRIAPKVADALRRIEPEWQPAPVKREENFAVCEIGGQIIPVQAHEVWSLYHQMRVLVQHGAGEERSELHRDGVGFYSRPRPRVSFNKKRTAN